MIQQLPPFAVPSYTALAAITGVVYNPGQTAVLPNGTLYEWTGTQWVMIGLAGAMNTYETASMGFDPSTGRTPVEQTNNYANAILLTGTPTQVIKAAPGFLHAVNISTFAAVTTGTHLALYDSATVPAAGTAAIAILPLPAAGAAQPYPLNVLFTAGLSVAVASITAATGVTAGHAFTGGGVGASISFR